MESQSHAWEHPLWEAFCHFVQSHHRRHACAVAPLPLWRRHVGSGVDAVLRPAWCRAGSIFDLCAPLAGNHDPALCLPADRFTAFDDKERAHTGLCHSAAAGGAWACVDVAALAWAHRAHRELPEPIPSHSVQWNGVWTGEAVPSYGALAEMVARLAGGAVEYGPELAVTGIGISCQLDLAPALARLGFAHVRAPRLRLGTLPAGLHVPPSARVPRPRPACRGAAAAAAAACCPPCAGRRGCGRWPPRDPAGHASGTSALAAARGRGDQAAGRAARPALRGWRDGGLLHHLRGPPGGGGGGAPLHV